MLLFLFLINKILIFITDLKIAIKLLFILKLIKTFNIFKFTNLKLYIKLKNSYL